MDTKKERLKYLVGDFRQVISPSSLKLDAKDVVIRNFIRCQKGTCKSNNYTEGVDIAQTTILLLHAMKLRSHSWFDMIWCCCTCFKSTCNCCWVYHHMTRQIFWACLHMSHDQRCSCLYLGHKDPTGVIAGTFSKASNCEQSISLWDLCKIEIYQQ